MREQTTKFEKNTLVLGLGASGLSCLEYFSQRDADASIYAFDDKLLSDAQRSEDLSAQYPNVRFIKDKSIIPFYEIDECVATPGIADSHTVVKRFLDSQKPVVCDVELFARSLSDKTAEKNFLPTVAVTGTNGKSTVVSWLAHVLTTVGKKTILAGNIGKPVLDFLNGKEESLSEFDVAVLELSSFQLERTQSLNGHVALVLNISPDHMDRYATEMDYQNAKERIYKQAAAIVINEDAQDFDLPYVPNKISFSIKQAADISVVNVKGERVIAVDSQNLVAVNKLPLIGEHNLSNALAVLACCKALKVDINTVAQALLSFKGLPHRSEFVAEIAGVRYINDSKATNADATIAAVAGDVSSLILIVGGDSKQADLSELRTALQGKLKHVIALGQDADLFVELFTPLAKVEKVDSLQTAVQTASELSAAGDTVLLSPACSSLDMFKNYIERGNVFKQAVQELAA